MRLLAHQRLKDARTVMLYYSLPDEVYTHTLVDALLASGKRVLLPRVTGEGTMELRCYTGPQSLEQGAYNIMEPVGEVFSDYAQIDLAVIPGVAFDRQLNRMGRGKGYYDRLLPQLGCAYKIGICFDFQLVESIECEEHDIKMDEVISGKTNNHIEHEHKTKHRPAHAPLQATCRHIARSVHHTSVVVRHGYQQRTSRHTWCGRMCSATRP